MRLAPTAGWTIDLLELCVLEMPAETVAPVGGGEPPFIEAVNVLLLRRPELTFLIDTGPGIFGSWFLDLHSDLPGALVAAGSSLEAVDAIFLTHLHFDHVGGLFEGTWPDETVLRFPSARVTMLAEAAAAARAMDPDEPLNAATRTVAALEVEGRLVEAAHGDSPAHGVTIRSTPGHYPGHATVEIGGEDPLVFLGDIIHHPVHAQHPEWCHVFDFDRQKALTTRLTLLDELARRNVRVVAPHLRTPNVGRFDRAGDAYLWV
jgi:glyoxylase-like metal-dependent hydrolase (beta-lactamase superfamily II)